MQWRLLTECLSSTLQAVLTIGNTLNGNTFRGNARGFHLDALLKVVTQALAREVNSDVYLIDTVGLVQGGVILLDHSVIGYRIDGVLEASLFQILIRICQIGRCV